MDTEKAVREYWFETETGDRLMIAAVYKRRAWYTVEMTSFEGFVQKPKGFRKLKDSLHYAAGFGEKYIRDALEYWVKTYGSDPITDKPIADAFHIVVIGGENHV